MVGAILPEQRAHSSGDGGCLVPGGVGTCPRPLLPEPPGAPHTCPLQGGGLGPPLASVLMGKSRPFVDGGGLCSLGRWRPERRPLQTPLAAECFAALGGLLRKFQDPRSLLLELACKKHSACPFPAELIGEAEKSLCAIFRKFGAKLPLEAVPARQPFKLALIEEFLRLHNDPDSHAFYTAECSFATGVRIGVDTVLPRVPAVFEAKSKWKQYDSVLSEPDSAGELRNNYPTAEQNADVLEKQFLEEEQLGAMEKMDLADAQKAYGQNLRIASLGAIQKADDTFRAIHDGTHGTGVNSRITVQDQIVCPTAGDLKQAIRELENATFVFAADVKRAHRLVHVAQEDWGYQACRVSKHSKHVWLNCVGSFGVASAAYHWARLMSGVQRAVFHLLGQQKVFMLTYVDDILWLVSGKPAMDAIAVVLLFLVALGMPLSWRKCEGGVKVDWVGYHLDLQARSVGINQRRARWLYEWCKGTVQAGVVKMGDMQSVLGRMGFAFAALEHLRPFLGPLYKWSAALGSVAAAKIPKMVELTLRYIAFMLESGARQQRVMPCVQQKRELFRTDASASGEEIWVGGWSLDSPDLLQCRWFSEKLNRQNAFWAFLAGEPFRAIATLEMLATLVALVVFDCAAEGPHVMRCSASTDNLGNACVLRRWLTTQFPLNCVVMEIAAILHCRNMELDLEWVPRLQNVQADSLTNEDYREFNPALRQRFCLDEYEGVVLQKMFAAGAELYSEIKESLIKRGKQRTMRKETPLREREPW